MDVKADVVKWLRQMGFDGDVSKINFRNFLTPASRPVWLQLMKKVRPKQEVELIRKNMLLYRLSADRILPPGLGEVVKLHPPEQLEAYHKKLELEKKVQNIQQQVQENDNKLKELMMKNRLKYVEVQNLKEKIGNHERYAFLLKAKAAKLRKEIVRVEEMLQTAKTLTPVEETSETDQKEIMATLQACAEKLKMDLKRQKTRDGCGSNTSLFPTSQCSVDSLGPPSELGRTILSSSIPGGVSNPNFASNLEVRANLEDLLHSRNRVAIWNCLEEVFEKCKTHILLETQERTLVESSSKTEQNSLLKLYGVHVKNELLARKTEKKNEFLRAEVQQCKNQVLSTGQSERILGLRLKDAGLTAALDFMEEEIGKTRDLRVNKTDLRLLNEKIRKTSEQTAAAWSEINLYLNALSSNNEELLENQEHFSSLMRTFPQFTEDLEWAQLLSENLNTQEVELFSNFNFEANRSANFRSLHETALPFRKNLDSDVLHQLVSVIHRPSCFPEAIISEVAQEKSKFERMKGLRCEIGDCDAALPIYTSQQLEEREEYLGDALEKFDGLIRGDGGKMDHDLRRLKEVTDIWLEMPFGRYLSKERLLDGNNYEFYEKQYDYYYNQL